MEHGILKTCRLQKGLEPEGQAEGPGCPGLAPLDCLEPWEPLETLRAGWVPLASSQWIRTPWNSYSIAWQCSPHYQSWAGQPPRSGSPHRSNAVHWEEYCQLHPQTHTGGGQRPPWCVHTAAVGAAGSPGAGAQWGCVSTWGTQQ